MRYYDQYDAGQFPNQRLLCQAILDPRCVLEDAGANPLTVRLAAARDALTALESLIVTASAGLPALRLDAAARWGVPRSGVMLRALPWVSPMGEELWVAGAARPAPVSEGDGEEETWLPFDPASHAFPLMRAHGHIFRFFTGLCGALERVAREIALLYQLDAPALTWGTLAAGRLQNRTVRKLRDKDPALSAWVSGVHAARLAPAFGYRDLMEREGLLPLAVDIHSQALRWELATLNRPGRDDSDSLLNVDVQQACRTLLAETINVIDMVYYIMRHRLGTDRQPPW